MKTNPRDLAEVDLTDVEVLRQCLSVWEVIESLSYDYPRIRDLKIELQERWDGANLNEDHKQALYLNLIQDQTLKATSKQMNTGIRWIKRIIEEGLQMMSEVHK
jgi:hypothetical protein